MDKTTKIYGAADDRKAHCQKDFMLQKEQYAKVASVVLISMY